MTTRTPSKVRPAPDGSLEQIAYASVAGIPTVEPHDRDRLGYCVYLWMTQHRDPLDLVVKNAGARLLIGDEEALRRVQEQLISRGIQL
jgi:hypothetical protein